MSRPLLSWQRAPGHLPNSIIWQNLHWCLYLSSFYLPIQPCMNLYTFLSTFLPLYIYTLKLSIHLFLLLYIFITKRERPSWRISLSGAQRRSFSSQTSSSLSTTCTGSDISNSLFITFRVTDISSSLSTTCTLYIVQVRIYKALYL